MRANTIADFWARVDYNSPSGCWIWQGGTRSGGYGAFRFNGKIRAAHILAYELLIGPIPAGKILHHTCENRLCIRAGEHVIPVDRRTHIVELSPRAIAFQYARRTHCKHGHIFDVENTRILKQANQLNRARGCRACERQRLNGWERQRQANNLKRVI